MLTHLHTHTHEHTHLLDQPTHPHKSLVPLLPPFMSPANALRCDGMALKCPIVPDQSSHASASAVQSSPHYFQEEVKKKGVKGHKEREMTSKAMEKRWTQRSLPSTSDERRMEQHPSLLFRCRGLKEAAISAYEKLLNASVLWQHGMQGSTQFPPGDPSCAAASFPATLLPAKCAEWIKA